MSDRTGLLVGLDTAVQRVRASKSAQSHATPRQEPTKTQDSDPKNYALWASEPETFSVSEGLLCDCGAPAIGYIKGPPEVLGWPLCRDCTEKHFGYDQQATRFDRTEDDSNPTVRAWVTKGPNRAMRRRLKALATKRRS